MEIIFHRTVYGGLKIYQVDTGRPLRCVDGMTWQWRMNLSNPTIWDYVDGNDDQHQIFFFFF